MIRRLPWVAGGLLALAVADWSAFKLGWQPLRPNLFAGIVALLMTVLALELAVLLASLARLRVRPLRGLAGLAVVGGLLAACAGGMVNWLLSLQGAVILTEGEAVPLSRTGHLQEFEAGWLSDPDEMRLVLRLDDLKLLPEAGGFYPESRIAIGHGDDAWVRESVTRRRPAHSGPLWFHQGAFGFAPRIVLLRGGETLFDRVVPFLTHRQGRAAVTFDGEFEIEKESIVVTGSVELEGLDERMKGHPSLSLAVRKGDQALGRGQLLPGQFADLEGGYRVGFAGLKKWSEIDLSRRTYPLPIFIGGGVFLLGLLIWPVAVWRKW